jgi:ubiquinone/menaquinone biosynthesis C-methylase UbiE
MKNGAQKRFFMSEEASPVENKGAVAVGSEKVLRPRDKTLAKIWDENYALHRSWWKGPYDIYPVLRQVAQGAYVLDVGCGTGRYLVALHRNGFRAVGADLSREALVLLDPRYARVLSDVRQLPFSDRSFDAVTCYGVLGHLTGTGRKKTVGELFRVLRDHGVAFVEVLGRRDLRYGHGENVTGDTFIRGGIPHHHFSRSELSELFHSQGFAVQMLDERVSQKEYNGAKHTRHRIMMVAEKLRTSSADCF